VVVITLNHQMVIIEVHTRKNVVDDVLLDGGSRVNTIIYGLKCKLKLPPHRLASFNLKMVDFSYIKPLGIISNVEIWIHGIPYIVTFTIMNNAIDPIYFMLLGVLGYEISRMIHDWGTNMVTIVGCTLKIVLVSKYFE
jgi:hypothetical protein